MAASASSSKPPVMGPSATSLKTRPASTISEPSAAQSQDTLTPNQVEILKAFRAELEGEGHLKPTETLGTDDETLIRFLRARKFDLQASKRMITQCLQWRHQFEGIGIDGLYAELDPFDFPDRDQVFKYWPIYFHGIDKLGRPVNIQMFGSLDLNKLYSVIDKQSHFKVLVANCEALTREILPACSYRNQMIKLKNSSESDHPSQANSNSTSSSSSHSTTSTTKITNAFCIVDLKGFTLTQFWQIKNIARICFSISQDYYPETMGYLAIINAPKSFATIFKAVTPWLSKETISKINILGEDYQSTLLEHIDEENLPSFLGGTCQCNNQFSCSQNDKKFDRSPWLKERNWKNQSWRKFDTPNENQAQTSSQATQAHPSASAPNSHDLQDHDLDTSSNHPEQQNEVTDGGDTSDGALIINNSPKLATKK
ncbi:hypothetical protein, variant [Puccinia triticina 1-1 BBBD Race 1]|uniref:CRAL-TRIO domain-containing protein n=2 Tax=Puccinia triticina TaxID=208348 RepID=A0A180H2P4_PUCT1|nr:uncharacterized protein PtA15_8A565 [Puccinia triticina]OAV99296.1 hypothetical protein PTTG_06765 [Puccinia triticina 1-1 BBBD Race 1]OAV99297.1 hypothetical protein, variant [Puccinia triticina 1-1 BBBD Race 1]WAQ87659.1 hypothetical protein PtA15_8A565 [Puccinia triticina]WAR57519.1 hypothetical protein PtB15_8B569 [Puccinia triticina]